MLSRGWSAGWGALALRRMADLREAMPRDVGRLIHSPLPRGECGRGVHAQIGGRDELQRHQMMAVATMVVVAPRCEVGRSLTHRETRQ